MNHRPFEDWLLEDQPLTPEQKRELDAHLRICDICAAIAESNLALRSARLAAPAPGFTSRWQTRLVLARQRQRRRTLIGTALFSGGGLLMLALLIEPAVSSLIGSPAEWISALVRSTVFLYTTLMALTEAGSIMLRVLPGVVPMFLWLIIFSTLSGLGLLGSVSIWRLIRNPGGALS